MEVTIPHRVRRHRDGIRVHTASLHPADATRLHGIPVTSAERTLLDYAATATTNELARATDEARVLRAVTDRSLNEQFSRYPTHRGTPALRAAIRADPKLTRSEAERRFLELVREAGLPEPETNVMIAGWEVDFLWREQRLIVEVDGYAFHSMRSSFERDRRKAADLAAAGFRTSRVTWRRLAEEAVAVAVQLAAALSRG